jgi:iron complex transport system permease protein
MQILLHNPLADPYVIGVSGGAAVGGVLAIVTGMGGAWLPVSAGLGALISILCLMLLCGAFGWRDPATIVLVGVVLNTISSAVVTIIKMLVPASTAQAMLFWLVGGIGIETPTVLCWLTFAVLVTVVGLTFSQNALHLLSLGTTYAELLGLSAHRTRNILLSVATVLCAAVVAYTGLIGFVGLIVPNVVRRHLGSTHRLLIPITAYAGGILVVAADAMGRSISPWIGGSLPVGAITAITGGPFFLYLLRGYGRSKR